MDEGDELLNRFDLPPNLEIRVRVILSNPNTTFTYLLLRATPTLIADMSTLRFVILSLNPSL